MPLQTIKSLNGEDEYVLVPVPVYRALRGQIKQPAGRRDRTAAALEVYVANPVALARIRAGMTQTDLSQRMNVSQAYISKIEKQQNISGKLLAKVNAALLMRAGSVKQKRGA